MRPKNGLHHILRLTLSKFKGGGIDPKLVLIWRFGVYLGMLVPIRETGALPPQVAMAGRLP